MNDPTPGDDWLFADRYRVDAPIGTGGMAHVWSGYDKQLDRRVAIKMMHQAQAPSVHAGSSEANALNEAAALDRERFLREIRTTARLELPGIPAVYDFGVEDASGRIYLVMQLLYGQTLADLIEARDHRADPWPISWAAAIAAQVAATLVDVHRVDVVHRDIKPSNLMLTSSGLVKVFDFGVAILQGASTLPKLTRIGMTVGSPPYMPPEQVLGNPVGPASDVYALGCVLHEMVTGRVPFAETRQRSFQDHHVNTPAPPMQASRPDVPDELDDLVAAMLAKRSNDRPDAEAVYDALLTLVRSGPAYPSDDRDPRRPFLRPLAPSPYPRRAASALRSAQTAPAVPITVDEALDVRDRVGQLVDDGQLQPAIDMLEDAVDRAAYDPALRLEMQIDLATTLHVADEFTRAAVVFGEILPLLKERDDATLLRYYAGVSHAETGDIGPAIEYLTAFHADAEPNDPLYRDATYRLGVLLPVVGRVEDGLRYLNQLRQTLAAEYGPDSVHVKTLDRRIDQVRRRPTDSV